MRLLIVEDEPKVASFIRRGLAEQHYAVDVAGTGEDAIALTAVTPYDLVILDRMLPGMDGLQVCAEVRSSGQTVPILMLTARGTTADRVEGLDRGADDYLSKPFAFDELLARVRALLRRQTVVKSVEVIVGDLTLNTATHDVHRGGDLIRLSSKEYAILEYLMTRAGQVVTRTMLLEAIWDYDFHPGSNVVDVYIRYLRRKIDEPYEMRLLETLRGTGYRIRVPSTP
ncbi:MAG: response regulator transcription factor [Chloroflexota bacterium]